MMRVPVLAVAAWVAVVATGSALTWLVIDSAGQPMLDGSGPVPVASASDTPRSVRPPASPTRPSATLPSASGPKRATATPAAPAPPVRQGSWRAAAGSVVVQCAGGALSLQAATPADGYQAEVETAGPSRLEVAFKGPGPEVHVHAACTQGGPSFTTESKQEPGGEQERGGD